MVLIVVLCIFIPLAIIGLAVYGHRIYFQTCNTMSVLDQVNEKIKRRGDSMPPSEPAAEELQKMEPSNINWIKPIYVRNGSREAKQVTTEKPRQPVS